MNNYPLLKFHFSVQWGGERIDFTEVTGLDFESEVVEYRHGAQPDFSFIKIPGLKKCTNITFKRGTYRGDNGFFDWYKTIHSDGFRRDITISLLDEEHNPVIVWKAKNAWPTKVQSTDLKADANEVAIETMEVAHEGLTIHN